MSRAHSGMQSPGSSGNQSDSATYLGLITEQLELSSSNLGWITISQLPEELWGEFIRAYEALL